MASDNQIFYFDFWGGEEECDLLGGVMNFLTGSIFVMKDSFYKIQKI